MNGKHKCLEKYHNKKQTIALCLNDQCIGTRRICEHCIQIKHKNHNIIYLDINDKTSKIYNLAIYQEVSLKFPDIQKTIQQYFLNMYDNLEILLGSFNKFKFKIYSILRPIHIFIVQTFNLNHTLKSFNHIKDQNYNDNDIEIIVKMIKILDKPFFRDILNFQRVIASMTWKISKYATIYKSSFSSIFDHFQQLIKEWSIFDRQQWTQTLLNQIDMQKAKYHQEKSKRQQQQQKQKIEFQKRKNIAEFIQSAKQMQWTPVNKWITQGNALKDMQILQLSKQISSKGGYNNPLNLNYPITILQDINKIPNLFIIQNLKQLTLDNNQISQIQNINQLSNLEKISLGFNRISKIKNIHNLIKLKQIILNYNQITKIENLQTLIQLTTLRLKNNKIAKIQNLQKLVGLTILTLDNNLIKNIENLQMLNCLTWLSLDDNPLLKTAQNKSQSHKLQQKIFNCYTGLI